MLLEPIMLKLKSIGRNKIATEDYVEKKMKLFIIL